MKTKAVEEKIMPVGGQAVIEGVMMRSPKRIATAIRRASGKIEIKNDVILGEIKVSAERIINNGDDHIIKETCRVCRILRSSDVFALFCKACDCEGGEIK